MTSEPGPELVVGLVTPVGTNTGELAENICATLADYNYTAVTIRLSDVMPNAPKAAIGEDEPARIRRLIAAGDEFCRIHASSAQPEGDPAALARLAVREIRKTRLGLFRQDGDQSPVEQLTRARPRTAYVLHSLKRPGEVALLRQIYGDQFLLVGSQGSVSQREANLASRRIVAPNPEAKMTIVRELIQLDAAERAKIGQRVNETYPQADFFLRDNDVRRAIELLFGEPHPPDIGEYAMYVARASSARSLAASRKVGAAIVVDGAVVATGYNDVPHGQTPDVIKGQDTSEMLKRDNLLDTIRRLNASGLLVTRREGSDEAIPEDELLQLATASLAGGELMAVIEYQRAVHAEARAIDDATVRGVSPKAGTLYVTTYPCHLCYKHALSVQIGRIEYIQPYAKSRATIMYPEGSEERLVPFAGVAPRRYIQIFDERPPFVSDPSGSFPSIDRRVAQPLLGRVRDDDARETEERLAVNGLKEEHR